ncbi:hypothetical protein QUF80_04170 [Desulfococcaceae bacterium HSG8]|nr:hypothetical protein [Desulfococcaceae bacterium HSG8]
MKFVVPPSGGIMPPEGGTTNLVYSFLEITLTEPGYAAKFSDCKMFGLVPNPLD